VSLRSDKASNKDLGLDDEGQLTLTNLANDRFACAVRLLVAEGCRHPPPPAARCGSEEMFTAVKQAHPPTTVDFALPCSLVAGGRRNLAVVKDTVLELYELRVQSDDK
jgi:hypothetical protein